MTIDIMESHPERPEKRHKSRVAVGVVAAGLTALAALGVTNHMESKDNKIVNLEQQLQNHKTALGQLLEQSYRQQQLLAEARQELQDYRTAVDYAKRITGGLQNNIGELTDTVEYLNGTIELKDQINAISYRDVILLKSDLRPNSIIDLGKSGDELLRSTWFGVRTRDSYDNLEITPILYDPETMEFIPDDTADIVKQCTLKLVSNSVTDVTLLAMDPRSPAKQLVHADYSPVYPGAVKAKG